ncbi:unnamed protein product [Rhizophagus irregularis]|nr:unnamed protein product [Rhizophagus irregularis]
MTREKNVFFFYYVLEISFGGYDTSPSENNNMAGRLVEFDDVMVKVAYHHQLEVLLHELQPFSPFIDLMNDVAKKKKKSAPP